MKGSVNAKDSQFPSFRQREVLVQRSFAAPVRWRTLLGSQAWCEAIPPSLRKLHEFGDFFFPFFCEDLLSKRSLWQLAGQGWPGPGGGGLVAVAPVLFTVQKPLLLNFCGFAGARVAQMMTGPRPKKSQFSMLRCGFVRRHYMPQTCSVAPCDYL